ncbi:hypothetical protein BASA50_009131 [Batrachochytrium salamandrivorans]|uniref:Uncharacterized protein n=1 Tax=Batrachochytrium salamandrivorans TaxID=1357716 RepID=A0ABQ8F2V0_9FUNG|nr:hypothetical protein BASA62_006374 [Batrachochytrium salamandrivorans]KAH6572609.1 hypothetical protein BASA60_006532 [Batrachochytrium salamandrivorans]KAH6579227.1 hypothetical protein BASA61_010425 [Batrachochytrium salamandrivorans]KAH6591129.1 hypothetical protein BASA50_009131 [Batrachochytrium salamandrivorans]KAH9247321.1 hypothetical protein BASA81_015088 [Batrachochytrium salamandrivorans]
MRIYSIVSLVVAGALPFQTVLSTAVATSSVAAMASTVASMYAGLQKTFTPPPPLQPAMSIPNRLLPVTSQSIIASVMESAVHHCIISAGPPGRGISPLHIKPPTPTGMIIANDHIALPLPASSFLKMAWNNMRLMQRSCRRGRRIEPCSPRRIATVDAMAMVISAIASSATDTSTKRRVSVLKAPLPQSHTGNALGDQVEIIEPSINQTRTNNGDGYSHMGKGYHNWSNLTNTLAIAAIQLGVVVLAVLIIL